MRILIALDGSRTSEIVVQEALQRPWPIRTSFSLITVVDPFFFTKVPILFAETKEEARKFLEEHRERFGKAGWQAQTEVILGLGHPYSANWHSGRTPYRSGGTGRVWNVD